MVEFPTGPLVLPGELSRARRWSGWFAGRVKWGLIGIGLLLAVPVVAWIVHRPEPSGERAYRELQPFISNFLSSPKAAEFPAPEGISPIGLTNWRIDSSLKTKDQAGSPVTLRWECVAGFDAESGKYFPDSLVLDGKRVFESPAAQSVREANERKLAAERQAEQQRRVQAEKDAKQRQQKTAEDARQAKIDARQNALEAEGERQLALRKAKAESEYKQAQDLVERRTAGKWQTVCNFSGERTAQRFWGTLAPTLSGWRLKYRFEQPARIQFYSNEGPNGGMRVGPEIKLAAGTGLEAPAWARPGKFKVAVETKDAWSIAIEE
jgi:hypothetical protein